MNSLEYELYTITPLQRSTWPSFLSGMLKGVLVNLWLSNNNKWLWWVWIVVIFRLIYCPALASGLGLLHDTA